jgi:hypothetical protein
MRTAEIVSEARRVASRLKRFPRTKTRADKTGDGATKESDKTMRCPKSVTPRKVEANRRNAKSSTGPRTGRGKRNAKFNAMTLGLFAKHVVIPVCDGYKPEREFQSLLDGLHQEFQPVGLYEEWLVVKIAECMWRLRRATRFESGSVRQSAIWDDRTSWEDRLENQRSRELNLEIWALERAEKELRDSGSLSQNNYARVLPLVEEKRKRVQSERLVEKDFDREEFLACITDRRVSLQSYCNGQTAIEDDRSDALFDYKSLLPEDDMERILRYEERMHRQIDWAVQRLLEFQERRKTLEPTPNVELATTRESAKRSQ